MKIMRPAVIIATILILMTLLAGCGNRVPTRNVTGKNPWGNATPQTPSAGSGAQTPVLPTTTSPLLPVTIAPTLTRDTSPSIISPPPPENLTANLTLIDEKKLVFVWNSTAYNYTLGTPPLLIDYTLTVPNITKTRVERDPTSSDPNADRTVTITYPDPIAYFNVTVRDQGTGRIVARNGYGGQYDVSFSKKVWVRYPGTYIIQFSGNRVTADVRFLVPKEE